MEDLKKHIFFSVLLIILLYIVGTYIYHHIEGWNYLDALYFQTITFTTVGYGDLVPKTEIGKLFTMIISWIGVSIAFYIIINIPNYRERTIDARMESFFNYFRGKKLIVQEKGKNVKGKKSG